MRLLTAHTILYLFTVCALYPTIAQIKYKIMNSFWLQRIYLISSINSSTNEREKQNKKN